jgi:hypothetical protein
VSLRHRGKLRWSQRAFATGTTALLIAGLSSWAASSAAQGAAFGSCPDAFPVAELTAGMTATGLTVERGTTPDQFTATVLGVVDDGIATGLDLIVVDTDSPAIQRAGGIWAGMSGSPVYAADGRLIGAVAYSLGGGASSIAGITPAADMKQVLTRATAVRAARKVALPAALRQKLVASGAATATQTSAGMTQLAIPLGVSGLGQTRLETVSERLQPRIPHLQVYSAGAAAIGDVGSPADIFAGSNFAAAISYGALTAVGVGTTTAVCDAGTLAFGHPFLFSGQSSMSVHPATAVLVQPSLFGPFKVANPGGVVGTLDQDRLAAIRAQLGPVPAAVPVDSTLTSLDNGATRSDTTNVNLPSFVPDIGLFHLLSSLDRVADRIGGGTSQLRWVINGTRASGAPFTVDVSNMFASQFDVSFESIFQPADQLFALESQPFENAKITDVHFTGSISSTFGQYSIDSVLIRRPNGTYVSPPTDRPLRVEAGSQLNLRAVLSPFRSSSKVNADLSVVVPPDTAGGFGSVSVVGGSGEFFFGDGDGDGDQPATFDELLADLNDTAPNNSVNATLSVDKETSTGFIHRETHGRAVVDQVVQGEKFFEIQVVQPHRARPGVVAGNVWKLRSSLSAGPATRTFTFGAGSDRKLMGDWDGNGSLSPAVFAGGTWRIRPNWTDAPVTVNFGQAGDLPVVGDWNGDGKDTIGVYRAGRWLLRNANTAGPADLDFMFGTASLRPVTGDWNGDGVDTVGTFQAGAWSLRDQNSAGSATKTFTFGISGDQPVVGDWDVDGRDEPGVYRSGRWLLRNFLSGGTPSKSFLFGAAGNRAVVWG